MDYNSFAAGYYAAKDKKPFDWKKSDDWKNGFHLYIHSRDKADRAQLAAYARMRERDQLKGFGR